MMLSGKRFWLKVFSRRKAVENVEHRHAGVNQASIFEFALALKRLRNSIPEAGLHNALYLQELGLILPVEFEGGSYVDDVKLMREVVTQGPFAQGPFLDEVLVAALAIVK